MKTIHTTSFTLLGLLGQHAETGSLKLAPAADMTMVVIDAVNMGQMTISDPQIVTVRVTAEELRDLAAHLTTVANELDRMVAPLCEIAEPLSLEDALDIARGIIALEQEKDGLPDFSEEMSAKMTEINQDVALLARAGWQIDGLKTRLLAEQKEPDGHADGCGCGTAGPDLGTPPAGAPVEQTQPEQQQQEGGDSDEYEFITATRDAEGNLSWSYRAKGADRPGSQAHDEDVSEWSDDDIRDLTMSTLGVPEHQRDLIVIEND